MTDAKLIVDALRELGAGVFTGIPDSLLSKLSSCILEEKAIPHVIAANEGNAIGLAIGDFLATKRPGVVYMQNSGLGNVVNPITSLADPDVYSVPMFLVIGWRGEPGVHDEPQHVKQGAITLGQLNVLNIPYAILSENTDALSVISSLWVKMLERQGPVALVVRKGAIGGDYCVQKPDTGAKLKREVAIDTVLSHFDSDAFYVATTGKTGRELYEIRERNGEEQRDFLTVGGMGHASSIALGVAMNQARRWTVCFDGDGASIMHMGAMATVANQRPEKYLHVLLNNYAHESVGGQSTISAGIDFKKVAEAVGYTGYRCARTEGEIAECLGEIELSGGCWLFEIKLQQGARPELGRPKSSPKMNKQNCMRFLQKG